MRETIIYYYLIKKLDYLPISKDYKGLYDDVSQYLSELPNDLRECFLKKFFSIKIKSKSQWLTKLKEELTSC